VPVDVGRYIELFVNRRDVFAEQQGSGAYFPVRRELTEDDVAEHLAGFVSYGTYVVDPENNTVKYLVFDLDTHDEEASAHLCACATQMVSLRQSHESIEQRGLPMLLLESSGNKGTHVWLFLGGLLPAAQVRRWVAHDFMPAWNEKAKGRWPIEVFPKQDEVTNGFGNLVKMPLGRHAVSGKFSEFQAYDGWASGVHDVQPLDVGLVPVHLDQPSSSMTRTKRVDRGPQSPFPCVDAILYDGAGKGTRDNAMFHLALYLYGHAVPEEYALQICQDANENFDPPIPARDVERKVQGAYSGRYASAKCGTDWLRDFCPGPCRAGWTVVEELKPGGLKRADPGSTVEVQVVRRSTEGGRSRVTVTHPDALNEPTLICG
jgi:hypothetical protein